MNYGNICPKEINLKLQTRMINDLGNPTQETFSFSWLRVGHREIEGWILFNVDLELSLKTGKSSMVTDGGWAWNDILGGRIRNGKTQDVRVDEFIHYDWSVACVIT